VNIAITGASGFLGKALVADLRAKGHTVSPVSLRSGLRNDVFSACDAVVHLAGEPVAQRWTASVRKSIERSRVEGTRSVVAAIAGSPVKVLVSASAVGYYGARGEEILTETSAPGNDFLGRVAAAWEREALRASEHGVRVVCPRIGVVLGKGGGALARLLLPFRLGVGGRLGSGKQWMSWIHLDDLMALLEMALLEASLEDRRLEGPINAVAPNPVTNLEFTRALGQVLHRPTVFPVPAIALKALFGEMSQVLLEGQRVLPAAALQAGFEFKFPAITSALRDALDTQ
jgi:uncharacterized protein (TIGR01777 family)